MVLFSNDILLILPLFYEHLLFGVPILVLDVLKVLAKSTLGLFVCVNLNHRVKGIFSEMIKTIWKSFLNDELVLICVTNLVCYVAISKGSFTSDLAV